MTYNPKPIDTSKVVIDAEHLKLTELLSKNTHEIWAQQRIRDGWKYGSQRDDNLKLHPCLIPYEELSDSEKEYDRRTAMGVIKTLLALGYTIEGKGLIPQNADSDQDKALISILDDLKNRNQINISSLLDIQRKTIKIKPHTPSLYIVLAEAILQLGEPLIAYDILAEGFKHWENDVRLQQLMALALARSGATQRANTILNTLFNQGQHDLETLSLLARTYKDLWQNNQSETERSQHLQLAAQNYRQAYEKSQELYPGINAATMTLISGDKERARNIANAVKKQCEEKLSVLENFNSKDYWALATLGEACLILEEYSLATNWYKQAVKIAEKRYGDISSTRRNAKIILDYLEEDLNLLNQWFPLPKVAVFVGHILDLPNRPEPRFPREMETQVYQSVLERLRNLGVTIGYASAACGGDILFLEAILELKGEIHIVLPYPQEQFIKDSVDLIPDSDWKERFFNLIEQATEVSIACNYPYEETSSLYQYTNRLLHGLATMRSKQLDTELIPIALWDGKSGDGYGGTATMVKTWQDWGYKVEIIPPHNVQSIDVSFNPEPPVAKSNIQRPIMALLFADVVNFSRLTEPQIPLYVENFLGAIANLEAQKGYQAALKETWGDALYYVFPEIKDAGHFALEICDLVQSIDWKSKGLPPELNLRISLHAGPVYQYINPITKKTGYSGAHASYAARIEPITPPGKVYASKEFAAITHVENIQDFVCDYVGQTPLAKNYGTFPTYHVRSSC
jgi:class 3 adenylate cyclase